MPNLHFVMDIHVEVGPSQELGEMLGLTRRIIPIIGGSFSGPTLRGKVLPGGADWQYTRIDHVAVLQARYTLETDEGHLISVVNRGFRYGKPGLAAMLASGQHVPPSEYYFMSTPLFEAAEPSLLWMTRTIFVGAAQRESGCVLLSVWQVGDSIAIQE